MTDASHVLIVDDNANNRVVLRRVLKGVAAELHEVSNGFDALSMSLQDEYALILLNVQTPDMDGFEVCELLRADPRTADIPVILLTAASKNVVDKVRGHVAGATDYLTKPINDHILDVISEDRWGLKPWCAGSTPLWA
jgi:CheY-like chemotaxis protein